MTMPTNIEAPSMLDDMKKSETIFFSIFLC